MSIRLGNNIVAGRSAYQPSLFDFKWADHALNDPSWVRADTYNWLYEAAYDVAYDHLVSDITGKTIQSETIAGITITFYLAADGHKICMFNQNDILQALYDSTGIAWYYILDINNHRFKLPRTKWGFTGLRDTVGKYVAPGLPNITGTIGNSWPSTGGIIEQLSGAFTAKTKPGKLYSVTAAGSDSTNPASVANFRASDSNSIYGNSTTVQSPATQMYLYFYLGSFSDQALENAADLSINELEEFLDSRVATKQDIATAVNYDNITNCITEIPQDIKLELNNGKLTLKAGSKLYVPNGFEVDGTTPKFDEVVIENDVSSSTTSLNGQNIYIYSADYLEAPIGRTNNNTSGPTAPTSPSSADTWYDTTNNLVKRYIGSAWETYKWSLPFMLATGNGSVLTSIDQVFNGFGYIGSTIFALPGVKGLIPDGRNIDGTLKSIEFTLQNVAISSIDSNWLHQNFYINTNGTLSWYPEQAPQKEVYYDEEKNIYVDKFESSGVASFCNFAITQSDSGKIIYMDIKQPYKAVDYNGADFVVDYQRPTSANGYTWYRKYKSGWVEQGGIVTISLTATATNCQWSTGNFPVTMQNNRYNYSLSELSGWIYSVNGGTESLSTTTMGGWYQTSGGTVPRDLRITWRVEGIAA